jgi:hypothetical protein
LYQSVFMALTADQIKTIDSYQSIINNLNNILQAQVYLDPAAPGLARGLSPANITAINLAISTTLTALDTLVTGSST